MLMTYHKAFPAFGIPVLEGATPENRPNETLSNYLFRV